MHGNTRQRGFSLIELMIAILLASITAVVVLNVLTSYQARSNTLVGRNDAQVGAAVGLYSLEKEIRMAGAGMTMSGGPFCPQGINISYNNVTVANGAVLMPLRIIDGGAGPDQLEMIRSDSDFGAAPARLVQAMASTTGNLGVDNRLGLTTGDLFLVGASNGSKVCTLMQVSATPTQVGSVWTLAHAAGAPNLYNPADPSTTYAGNAIAYDVRDNVLNLGRYGVRRFGILCSDGSTTPAANNNCDLAYWDRLAVAAPALGNADVINVSSQIVQLQAQYGVADAGSEVVNAWVDATVAAGWDNPSQANQRRIKAVRISIVARGARDNGSVTPGPLVLWDDPGTSNDRSMALDADQQRFRYQVLTVVVPLINAIWTGA